MVIEAAHRRGRPVGFCGQAPSDHPEFAAFLVEAGIDSISVTPDSLAEVVRACAG
jgi:pyruvate,water dikinase